MHDVGSLIGWFACLAASRAREACTADYGRASLRGSFVLNALYDNLAYNTEPSSSIRTRDGFVLCGRSQSGTRFPAGLRWLISNYHETNNRGREGGE